MGTYNIPVWVTREVTGKLRLPLALSMEANLHVWACSVSCHFRGKERRRAKKSSLYLELFLSHVICSKKVIAPWPTNPRRERLCLLHCLSTGT